MPTLFTFHEDKELKALALPYMSLSVCARVNAHVLGYY